MEKITLLFIAITLNTTLVFCQKSLQMKVEAETIYSEDFKPTSTCPQIKNDSIISVIDNGVFRTAAKFKNFNVPRKIGRSLGNTYNLWQLNTVVQYADGDGYFGLKFGSSDEKTKWAFLINGNAGYVILEINATKGTRVLKEGKSEKINKGKDAINIFTVQMDNDYLWRS